MVVGRLELGRRRFVGGSGRRLLVIAFWEIITRVEEGLLAVAAAATSFWTK
jgi:hypothetical protein